jgi:SAM-dependent methyltransferase
VAARLGYDNVEFRRGRIQDLRLDLDLLDRTLADRPMNGADAYLETLATAETLRRAQPLVADESVDVIVSNCVLNLVRPEDKPALFAEMYRVTRTGGRVVISDIVSDEDIPDHLRADESLWSGCVSGAYREDAFLRAFEEAGFHGIRILERQSEPWVTVEGIEFRSLTVEAFKGKAGPCWDTHQAVVYRGPWRAVIDDDGHTLYRGERMAVCEKTFRLYTREPYARDILPVEPRVPMAVEDAAPFACDTDALRPARVTKGEDYNATTEPREGCGPEGCC